MIGVSPEVFWTLTPYQFGLCMRGYEERERRQHDAAIWVGWHTAAFQKSKRLPPLKDYLSSSKKRMQGVDEDAIMARLKAYQKRVNDGPGS